MAHTLSLFTKFAFTLLVTALFASSVLASATQNAT
jgi:hypothetical protein